MGASSSKSLSCYNLAMMANQPHYRLKLLGSFALELANAPEQQSINLRRKERAILAYLLVEQRPFSRQHLINLFTANAADPLHALRVTLSRLRRQLDSSVLLTVDNKVQVDHTLFATDILKFNAIAHWSKSNDSFSGETKQVLAEFTQTLSLYQGDFLADLHLPNAPEFDAWLLAQRSRWQQMYERGALALIKAYAAQNTYAKAIALAQQLVQHNPLLEEAHHQLMRLYAQTGQTAAALAQYDHCQAILKKELAVTPMPALTNLRAAIAAGQTNPAHAKDVMISPMSMNQDPAVFVERTQELAQLHKLWTAVQVGQSGLVLVDAPAGGGKTRLVHTFAAQLPPTAFVAGTSTESTRSLPYHPWTQLLTQVQATLAEDKLHQLPIPWQTELAHLLPTLAIKPVANANRQKEQTFAAVYALLQCAPHSLCLFLDDLQWADAASLELLHYIAVRARAEVETAVPLLLVGAYRIEEAEDNAALQTLLRDWARWPDTVRQSLSPLTGKAIAAVFQNLGAPLPASTSIAKATGGNPLFVVELARKLADEIEMPAELPVPPSLGDLIQQRLRQLSSSGRQVVESLAILDQPASFDLLRQISARSEEETLQAVELGLRWRLVQTSESPATTVHMAHDLMQEAVRQQMSAVRRQILHRRTAQVLAQHHASPATLCYHWHHAGNQEQETHFAVLAAEAAVSVHAYYEAVHYLRRALPLTPEATKQAELLRQLGRAQALLGEWEQAEQAFVEGLQVLGATDGRLQATIQADYGRLLEQKGDYATATAQDEAALDYFAQSDDRSQMAQLRGHLGLLAWRQSQYDRALAHYQAGLADDMAMRDPQTRIILHNGIGLVQWRLQQYDEALEHFAAAYETAVAQENLISQVQVQCNTGNIYAAMSQIEAAISHYRQAYEIASAIQYKAAATLAVGNLGLMYYYQGDDEQALDHCQQALDLSRELGNKSQIAHQLSNISTIYFRQNRVAEAFAYCQESFVLNTELGDRRGMLIDAGNMGHLYLLWGEPEAALICLHYALQLDDRLEHPIELARHLSNLADVYLLLGELLEAERLCRQAIKLQKQHDNQFELAWTLWLVGRLQWTNHQPNRAHETLHQARELAEANTRADLVADIDRTLAALQNGDDPVAYGRTLLKPNLPPAPALPPHIAQAEVQLPLLWQKITTYLTNL